MLAVSKAFWVFKLLALNFNVLNIEREAALKNAWVKFLIGILYISFGNNDQKNSKNLLKYHALIIIC